MHRPVPLSAARHNETVTSPVQQPALLQKTELEEHNVFFVRFTIYTVILHATKCSTLHH